MFRELRQHLYELCQKIPCVESNMAAVEVEIVGLMTDLAGRVREAALRLLHSQHIHTINTLRETLRLRIHTEGKRD